MCIRDSAACALDSYDCHFQGRFIFDNEKDIFEAKLMGITDLNKKYEIKEIVKEIQEMINIHPKTNDDGKVRFQEFGASSLDVLILYYVDSPKWEDLINAKEDINYKIMDIVKKHNSDFAFPSTSVYLQQNT